MKLSPNSWRIGIAALVIVGTIGWLARLSFTSGSYYVKVGELYAMGDKAHKRNLQVDGFVVPGTIKQNGTHVDFVINEFESHTPDAAKGRLLTVSYKGAEPPPDTFKGDAEAVASGTFGRDGVFHATALQAKCASKYAPTQPGAAPAASPSTVKPSTAQVAAPAANLTRN